MTLPSHKAELRPVAAHTRLRIELENACRGLSITPEQLRQELEAGGDLPDLVFGTLTPKALRLTARTLALAAVLAALAPPALAVVQALVLQAVSEQVPPVAAVV